MQSNIKKQRLDDEKLNIEGNKQQLLENIVGNFTNAIKGSNGLEPA